jgi:hypothetical protein
MKPIKSTNAPLTEDQQLIARLFGMMDDRRQREMLRYATAIATAFPRSTAPALRIVKGGDQ